MAYIFAIYALPYTMMSFFVGSLAKKFGSRAVSVCSYIIIAIGCLIFGPLSPINKILGDKPNGTGAQCTMDYIHKPQDMSCNDYFETRRTMSYVGLIILGTGAGTVVVPLLVELLTTIKEEMSQVSK